MFNGADDNASGVAALLEIAKLLQINKPKHHTIILFTDSEEVNLNGAKAFVRQFPEIVNSTKLNINLDMLSGDRRTNSLRYITNNLDSLLTELQLTNLTSLQTNAFIKIKKGCRNREILL